MNDKNPMPLHTMIFRLSQAQRKALFDNNNPTTLTSGQPKILRFLRHNGSKTQVEIATHCAIEPPTASRLIESLLKQGLIVRRDNEADKRSYLISITDKGLQQIERWDAYAYQFETLMFDGLDHDEQDQLRQWLNHIYRNITGRSLLDNDITTKK